GRSAHVAEAKAKRFPELKRKAQKQRRNVGHGKVEIQNQDSHFPTAPTCLRRKEKNGRLHKTLDAPSTDAEAPPRFPSPLIKPDVRISRIRLSDWLHRRLTNGPPTELDEPAVLRVRRTPFLLRNGWCPAIAPDGASAGSAV